MTGLGSIDFPALATMFNTTADYFATSSSNDPTLSTLYIALIAVGGAFILIACITGVFFGLKRHRRSRSANADNNMVTNPASQYHRRRGDDGILSGENPTSRLSNVSRESGYAAKSPMMTSAVATPVDTPVVVAAVAVRASPPPKPSRHDRESNIGYVAPTAPPPPPRRAPSPAPPPPPKASHQNHGNIEVAVKSLMDMGFGEEEAKSALRSCHNDVEQAANQLLSGRKT